MIRNAIAISEVNPELTISKSGAIYRLDARSSMGNLGAVTGLHTYILSGEKQTVDMSIQTPAVLQAGITAGNVIVTGDDVSKNIVGNSWNSAASSVNGYDTSVQDFACTWLIETITGTVREMAGITTTPNTNDSYTATAFAFYQVNNYVMLYESGTQLKVDGNANFGYIAEGDRIGIRIVDGSVEYIQMVGGNPANIVVLHTSSNTANGVYYFDCSLNRGNTSSGASVIEDVAWHVNTKQTNFTIKINGEATTDITEEHKTNLKNIAGILIEPGTKYSDVYYTRAGSKYAFDMDIIYYYSPATNALLNTIII